MEKLNVAIADDNERMLRLLGVLSKVMTTECCRSRPADGEEANHVIKAERTGCRAARHCDAEA